MKKSFIPGIVFVLFGFWSSAQYARKDSYFIYLQTDPQQPFFVRMDENLYPSTTSGYIILPKLKDSTYSFAIGFAGAGGAEHRFTCTVNKKDHGYLVKNFGDQGWGLFDLQTSAVQMAISDPKPAGTTEAPVNAFTDLLSKAADDSTLKQKIVLPAEEKKPETVVQSTAKNETLTTPAPEKKDRQQQPGESKIAATPATAAVITSSTPAVKKEAVQQPDTTKAGQKTGEADTKITATVETAGVASPKEELKKETARNPDTVSAKSTDTKTVVVPGKEAATPVVDAYSKTKITRKSESSTTEGFGLIYIDTYPDGKQDTISLVIPAENSTKLVDNATGTTSQVTENKPIAEPEKETAKVAAKNNCKSTAGEDDFFRLRKKMASQKSDAAMIGEAVKIFKTKCFSTSQVRNLGSLFIGDGGKYQFFDAAYTHVSDTDNFPSLQSELKDEYFVDRFKALLK